MRHRIVRAVVVAAVLAAAPAVPAQRGPGGAPPQPRTAQASAPVDLTGYWVSIVNEDWRWRMVTPLKGDYASIQNLMTPEARKIADAWDPATDGSCLAYGAAGLMRIPTRLRITWENESTLKVETDAGQQTRRFTFGATEPPATRSLQGFSAAEWELPAGPRGGGPGGPGGGPGPGPAPGAGGPAGAASPAAQQAGSRGVPLPGEAGGTGGRGRGAGAPGAPAPGGPRGGSLKVVTTRLSGGWLRKNGVPYSENATVTEYYDRFPVPPADEWLVVTTVVADPKYLTQEFVTSTHFRREPDGRKWDPTPCRPAS